MFYIYTMENTIDLFEQYDKLPYAVKQILESNDELKDSYKENNRMIKALAPLGYTFDYGLCGEPMDLKRIYNEKLMALVEKEGRVPIITTGLDMDCKEVLCRGVLYKENDQFILRSEGVDIICDNLCDMSYDASFANNI